MGKETKTLEPGSYSWGTMRTGDVLEACMRALAMVGYTVKGEGKGAQLICPDGTTSKIEPCSMHGFDGPDGWGELNDEEKGCQCNWLLNEEIWDLLQEYCPECHTWGSSEGDGADYGVWFVGCDGCDEFEDCKSDLKETE